MSAAEAPAMPANLHGTLSGYSRHGCRCPSCTETTAQYRRNRRARLKTTQGVCAAQRCTRLADSDNGLCHAHTWRASWPLPPPDHIPDTPTRGWHQQANCLDEDTELFFLEKGEHVDPRVVQLCAECPVRGDCLAAALTLPPHVDADGIRGGMNPRARNQLRKELR